MPCFKGHSAIVCSTKFLLNWIDRIESDFWSKVDKSGNCWLWMPSSNSPYGSYGGNGFSYQTRITQPNRISWVIANRRKIPAGMVVRHKCDNKRCVNPDHLEIGTCRDNYFDWYNRGGREIIAERKANGVYSEWKRRAKARHANVS